MWSINPLQLMWEYITFKNFTWKMDKKHLILYPFVSVVFLLILSFFLVRYWVSE